MDIQEQQSESKKAVAPSTWQSIRKGLKDIPVRIGIAGIWLVLLYVIFGTFVVFSLTAHQLQHSIRTFKSGDKPLTVWQMTSAHKKWKVAVAALENTTPQLVKSNENLAKVEAEVGAFQQLITSNKNTLDDTGKTLRNLLQVEDVDANIISKLELSEFRLGTVKTDIAVELFTKLSTNEDYAAKQTRYSKSAAYVRDLEQQLSVKRAESGQLRASVTRLEGRISASKLDSENALTINGEDVDPRIGDFLNSFTYLEAKEGIKFLPAFSKMPPDMLTLILVLAMGALGGTIHLTQLYFNQRGQNADENRDKGAGYFLFRPFLGAIVALSVFILAKAGVLIVASPSPQGEGASLSPFFISFIGLVSGLLAEQALATIQRTGTSWFGAAQNVGRERWAYGLKKAMGSDAAKRNTSKLELANLLGVLPKDIDKWMNEEVEVPSRYQVTVAAYVNKQLRQIFTDIKTPDLKDQPAD